MYTSDPSPHHTIDSWNVQLHEPHHNAQNSGWSNWRNRITVESNVGNNDEEEITNNANLYFEQVKENSHVFCAGTDEVCSSHFNSACGLNL